MGGCVAKIWSWKTVAYVTKKGFTQSLQRERTFQSHEVALFSFYVSKSPFQILNAFSFSPPLHLNCIWLSSTRAWRAWWYLVPSVAPGLPYCLKRLFQKSVNITAHMSLQRSIFFTGMRKPDMDRYRERVDSMKWWFWCVAIMDACLFERALSCTFLKCYLHELNLKRNFDCIKLSDACETLPSCATLLLFDNMFIKWD